jgi:hypothetical protein
MNEIYVVVKAGRAGVIKLLHKGNRPQVFLSRPSNFFARPTLFRQSGGNPEEFRVRCACSSCENGTK